MSTTFYSTGKIMLDMNNCVDNYGDEVDIPYQSSYWPLVIGWYDGYNYSASSFLDYGY